VRDEELVAVAIGVVVGLALVVALLVVADVL
jgi:hypothetical protein